eukprot:2099355-Pyramimonas_sp.AAC.1
MCFFHPLPPPPFLQGPTRLTPVRRPCVISSSPWAMWRLSAAGRCMRLRRLLTISSCIHSWYGA